MQVVVGLPGKAATAPPAADERDDGVDIGQLGGQFRHLGQRGGVGDDTHGAGIHQR